MNNIKEQYAFKTTYDIKLDLKAVEDYKSLFESHLAPSKSKATVVADVITSIPNVNSNAMGFTAKTLKNSYQTMKTVPIDYEHSQEMILGNVIEPFLIEEDDNVILRVAGIMWKKPLRYLGIDDLTLPKWSMECFHTDYAFYTQSKGVIEKDNAPVKWVEQLENWDYGEPVIDEENGERVILLLGGSDGIVEFSGLAVTWNPADKTTQTLYQAASEKNKGSEVKLELTEKQLQEKIDEAIASVKAEYDKKLDEAKASVLEKDNLIKEYDEKLKTAEASVLSEKDRADKAEGIIKEREIADRFASRKEVLASKKLSYRQEKESFIKDSNDEQFNDWVADLEALASSFVKEKTASANEKEDIIVNLTGNDKEDVVVPKKNPLI